MLELRLLFSLGWFFVRLSLRDCLLSSAVEQCNFVLLSDPMKLVVFELLNVIDLMFILMEVEVSIIVMILNKIFFYLLAVLDHCWINLKVLIENQS